MIGEIGLFLLGLLVGGLAYSLVLCLLYGVPKSLYWAAKGLVSYRLALSYAGFASIIGLFGAQGKGLDNKVPMVPTCP